MKGKNIINLIEGGCEVEFAFRYYVVCDNCKGVGGVVVDSFNDWMEVKCLKCNKINLVKIIRRNVEIMDY